MKIKKIIVALLFASTLLASGLLQTQPVFAAINKKQAVSIIKKNNNHHVSGKSYLVTKIKSKKDQTVTKYHGYFNNKKQLLHVKIAVNDNTAKNKTQTADYWIDGQNKRFYRYNADNWETWTLAKSPNIFPEINEITGSKSLTNIASSMYKPLLKTGKLTYKNGTYKLKGSVQGKKFFKPVMQILLKKRLNKKALKFFKKNAKIGRIDLVYTLKKGKVTRAQAQVNAVISKYIKITATESFNRFNKYGTLSLPEDVKSLTLTESER